LCLSLSLCLFNLHTPRTLAANMHFTFTAQAVVLVVLVVQNRILSRKAS
jgi:hypothetical protein